MLNEINAQQNLFCENPENNDVKTTLDSYKNKLENLIKYETEGAAVRTKVQCGLDGEKPNWAWVVASLAWVVSSLA